MAENSVKTAMSRRGVGRPFKPGQSGNPGGRPKSRALTDALEQTIDKHELGEKLWALALKGDMQAIKYIYDRIEGTPTQLHEFSIEDYVRQLHEVRPDLTEEQGKVITFRARELVEGAP